MKSKSYLPKIFWSGFFLILSALFLLILYRCFRPSSFSPPIYGEVPAFTLTNQLNQIVTKENLLGNVWIANFIFTTCPGPCLFMSQRTKQIQDSLDSKDKIRLISFTVDPQTDTPSILSHYGQQFQADPRRWYFLTGNQDEIFALATKGFLLAVAEVKEAKALRENGRYIHSTKLALVDTHGKVRGYYEGTQSEIIPQLIKEARALAK